MCVWGGGGGAYAALQTTSYEESELNRDFEFRSCMCLRILFVEFVDENTTNSMDTILHFKIAG